MIIYQDHHHYYLIPINIKNNQIVYAKIKQIYT